MCVLYHIVTLYYFLHAILAVLSGLELSRLRLGVVVCIYLAHIQVGSGCITVVNKRLGRLLVRSIVISSYSR